MGIDLPAIFMILHDVASAQADREDDT